jgi:hypothetical protein
MSALSIQPTYPIFTDIDGQPLEDGYVWIGTANLDPQTNPINVYWDAALTLPAAQPIRTLAGYPANSGTPARLYVNSDYSIRVMNKNGSAVYSAPAATERYNEVVVSSVDASNVTYTPPVGGVATTVEDKLARYISVLDFGADPTGVNDSTAAFQAALDAAKGANSSGVGRTVFSLYIPSYPGGFYKISNTLLIDGTHGLKIFGDGAFTQRNNFPGPDSSATIRWYGGRAPIFQLRGRTDAISNPNFNIKIQDLTISGYPTAVTPSTGVPAGMALSGIHIGNVDNFNENTLARMVEISNVVISNCRFGIWSGNPDGFNTDHATVNIDNCYINSCPQAGLVWGTGNSIAVVKGCHIVLNGWGSAYFPADAYMPQKGANVYVNSGYVDLVGLTTAGADTYKPTDADIYQESGRVSIINAWSDTHGYFFYQASASQIAGVGRQIAQITGVRHWEGTMTAVNTPDSIFITAPGTVVTACAFYGNVVVQSGISGRPVFAGIQFGRTNSTFIGSGVEVQRSLINIGSGTGNFAQITMGGADAGVPLTKKGDNPNPHMLFLNSAISLMELAPAAAAGTGFHWYARGDDANGAHELYFNCYYSNAAGGYVPFQNTKQCVRLQFGGPRGFQVYLADPNGSSGLLTWVLAGGFRTGDVSGLRTEIAWEFPKAASDPTFTSGDWWEGSVYYNTATNKLRVNTGASTWVDLH